MSKPSCVIVGAGPGLGLSLARRFARGGFEAALVGRKQGRLDRLAEALIAEGHGARGFDADAGDEAALTAAFGRIAAWNGDVGVLIYNAADMAADSVTAMTPGVMMARMAANLGGAITSVNRVLPAMRDRGAGTILITGGGLALEPYPDWAALSAGKAALLRDRLAQGARARGHSCRGGRRLRNRRGRWPLRSRSHRRGLLGAP